MQFSEKLEKYINEVNLCLENALEDKKGSVYDAMRYSLLSGGKRIRPVLSLACAEALGGDSAAALYLGCAVEMVHSYSLIHDDLPCMDNDDLRRGKPTNHIVFGEANAVLAGDALLNFACEFLLNSPIDDDKKLKGLRVLFSASGADGMIGGQSLDIEAETRAFNADELTQLHNKKTGAIINAAVSMGAIAAGHDEFKLYDYSSAVGLAFQIRDDILDVSGDEKVIGKPINSDLKNNKTTFVSLFGIDGASKKLEEETQKAIDSIEFLGEKGEFLRQFALYLLKREA